jgi:gluconolactonase
VEAELRDIVGNTPQVTEIARGAGAKSGPAFSRRGYLLFCNESGSQIWKWQDGRAGVFIPSSRGAKSLTFDHQGRLLACEKNGVTRTEKDESVTILAKQPEPADIVYAIDGNIYFCAGSRVYRVARDAKITVASEECQRPVGIALSPKQQILYVTDAGKGQIWSFDISADGSLGKGHVFGTPAASRPGGLKTDEAGRVWVAAGDPGVRVFNHEGKLLGSIPIPGQQPNNLNWGEGFRNLFVTTESSVFRVEARTNGTRTY